MAVVVGVGGGSRSRSGDDGSDNGSGVVSGGSRDVEGQSGMVKEG